MTTAKFNPQYLLFWLNNFIHPCVTKMEPLSLDEVVQVKWNRRLISFRIHVPDEFSLGGGEQSILTDYINISPADSFQAKASAGTRVSAHGQRFSHFSNLATLRWAFFLSVTSFLYFLLLLWVFIFFSSALLHLQEIMSNRYTAWCTVSKGK